MKKATDRVRKRSLDEEEGDSEEGPNELAGYAPADVMLWANLKKNMNRPRGSTKPEYYNLKPPLTHQLTPAQIATSTLRKYQRLRTVEVPLAVLMGGRTVRTTSTME